MIQLTLIIAVKEKQYNYNKSITKVLRLQHFQNEKKSSELIKCIGLIWFITEMKTWHLRFRKVSRPRSLYARKNNGNNQPVKYDYKILTTPAYVRTRNPLVTIQRR